MPTRPNTANDESARRAAKQATSGADRPSQAAERAAERTAREAQRTSEAAERAAEQAARAAERATKAAERAAERAVQRVARATERTNRAADRAAEQTTRAAEQTTRAAERVAKATERARAAAGFIVATSDVTSTDKQTTRERILDVALDLFVDQGYDKTSLREVAEKMGFTKAALYYHFPGKADMLSALHERMHSLMDEPLAILGTEEGTVSVDDFERFLGMCLDQLQANGKLFVLHRVNQAAIGKIHIEGHHDRHTDMEERARRLFSDRSLSETDRLRMAAAFSTTMVTPMILTGWFPGVSSQALDTTLKDIIHQILHPQQVAPREDGRPQET